MALIDEYPALLAALCVWREARGESREAKRGVAHVIANRANKRFRGSDPVSVVLAKWQFSSFNANDPNALKFPSADDAAWRECCEVIADPGPDLTLGALSYHSTMAHPPGWAKAFNVTARIGAFTFYRA